MMRDTVKGLRDTERYGKGERCMFQIVVMGGGSNRLLVINSSTDKQ